MAIGYILITAESGKEIDVGRALRNYIEIEENDPLFGEYDFISKLDTNNIELSKKYKNVEDHNKIGLFVMDEIRSIDGVVDTKTLLTVDLEN